MLPIKAITTTLLAAATLATVQASSLEGAELEAYDAYCPAGNQRAVWAELLPGILTDWVKLVCLDEDIQQTSSWYITPEGDVVLPDEAELPVYVRPMADTHTLSSINAVGNEEKLQLWLDFVYDEPTVPSLEFYGAPADIIGVSGSATTGPNGEVESSYELNGQPVSEAEYIAWQTSHRTASQAQNAERDRLILQQVHLSLYDLIELNQWHSSFDVNAINSGYAENAYWQYNSSLIITLSGAQARKLLESSEGLVFVSTFTEASTDDGGGVTGFSDPLTNDDTILPSSEQNADDTLVTNLSIDGTTSSGGMLSLFELILLALIGLRGGFLKRDVRSLKKRCIKCGR